MSSQVRYKTQYVSACIDCIACGGAMQQKADAHGCRHLSMHATGMQGVLVNSEEDINIIMSDDDAALAGLLGAQKYFFGNEPTITDACVFGFLQGRLYSADPSSHNALSLRKHDNLVAFVDRIREEFFADRLAKLAEKEGKMQ